MLVAAMIDAKRVAEKMVNNSGNKISKMFLTDFDLFQLSSPSSQVVEESLDSKSDTTVDDTSSLKKKATASVAVGRL
jgi:hypothetical protein